MNSFQWIPCSDNLPNEYGYYLVTIKLSNSNEVDYEVINALYSIDDGFNKGFCQSSWPYKSVYNIYGTKWDKVEIIAWAHHPKPYKE